MSAPTGYFAIKGTLQFISGGQVVSAATNKLVGVTFTEEFGVAKLKDGPGNTISMKAFGAERKATFEFVPVDANGNEVTAAANVKVPDRLSLVTIAGTGLSILDGTWNFVGPFGVNPTTEAWLKCSAPCEKPCADTLGNGAFAALS